MENLLKKACDHLQQEKTILYPTDTVWGLGCDATNDEAVAKIYKIKEREESKSLVVLVSSLNMLKKHVSISEKVKGILNKATIPTTIIYTNPKGISQNVIAKDNTVAIRIVQDTFCRKLIKSFGKPIVSTSANVSGEATPKSFSEISQPILEGVDYIVNLNLDRITEKSSTILKIKGDTIEVIRA
ncbi:MAG: threonylcarbamoyl-AMP synthase [Flavobacteriaceae bacterium]|nr:threonylcarbamoyl-AMP synthase [Flavobacteriaceae bacterium]